MPDFLFDYTQTFNDGSTYSGTVDVVNRPNVVAARVQGELALTVGGERHARARGILRASFTLQERARATAVR